MTALVDTGAECTLIHGDPQKFSGPLSATDGYGVQVVMLRKVPLTLQIGCSPLWKYEGFVFFPCPPTPSLFATIRLFSNLWVCFVVFIHLFCVVLDSAYK